MRQVPAAVLWQFVKNERLACVRWTRLSNAKRVSQRQGKAIVALPDANQIRSSPVAAFTMVETKVIPIVKDCSMRQGAGIIHLIL